MKFRIKRPKFVNEIERTSLISGLLERVPSYIKQVDTTRVSEELVKDMSHFTENVAHTRRRQRHGSAHDQFSYFREVFLLGSSLRSAFHRLESCCLFMSLHPLPKRLPKGGIQITDWIEYHYGVYVLTVTGLYDTLLVLTASVFDLGLTPRDCNPKTVLDNRHTESAGLKRHFKSLDKLLNPIREQRNPLAHQSTTPSLLLADILGLYLPALAAEGGIETQLRAGLEAASVAELAENLEATINKILPEVGAISEILFDKYKRRKLELPPQ